VNGPLVFLRNPAIRPSSAAVIENDKRTEALPLAPSGKSYEEDG
jgi:hypothetical protein